MCNLYREPSIYDSYQVSVHLSKRFKRRRFLEIDQSETRIACGGMFVNVSGRNELSSQRTFHRCFLPSFGPFGQAVSEEKIFQNSTNQKQEQPVVAMFVNGSGRNEQSLQRTFHISFLLSFSAFGYAVSEEKILKNRPIRNKNCLWWPCL